MRVELGDADAAVVGAVADPERAVGREDDAGIDGVEVLVAIGGDDHAAVGPFIGGVLGIEHRIGGEANRGLERSPARHRVVEIELIAQADDVRRPDVGAVVLGHRAWTASGISAKTLPSRVQVTVSGEE